MLILDNKNSELRNILKPNWFSDSDASTFANAEAYFKIKIRKPLRVK